MASVFVCRSHDVADQGAQTAAGLTEWMISADVNQAIKDILWPDFPAYRLQRTLEERIDVINKMCASRSRVARHAISKPAHAIEVHCNSVDDPSRAGFHVMAHVRSHRGQKIARYILREISALRPGVRNWGVNLVDRRRQWIGTVREYEASRQGFICGTVCPAVLVESCFLSNIEESAWISEKDNRYRLGRAIGRGLHRYLKGVA